MASKIVSHDDFFIAVGKVTNMAAVTDSILFSAFHVIAGNVDINVSRSVFYAFDALPSRINLINRLLEASGTAEEKKIVNNIILACKKANNQRKQVAHAISLNMPIPRPDEKFDFQLKVYHPKSNKEIKPTELYIQTIIDHSMEAYNDAVKSYAALTKERNISQVLYY